MVLEAIRRRLGGAVEHFGLSSSQLPPASKMDNGKRRHHVEKEKQKRWSWRDRLARWVLLSPYAFGSLSTYLSSENHPRLIARPLQTASGASQPCW
jgi:hypothetical protein